MPPAHLHTAAVRADGVTASVGLYKLSPGGDPLPCQRRPPAGPARDAAERNAERAQRADEWACAGDAVRAYMHSQVAAALGADAADSGWCVRPCRLELNHVWCHAPAAAPAAPAAVAAAAAAMAPLPAAGSVIAACAPAVPAAPAAAAAAAVMAGSSSSIAHGGAPAQAAAGGMAVALPLDDTCPWQRWSGEELEAHVAAALADLAAERSNRQSATPVATMTDAEWAAMLAAVQASSATAPQQPAAARGPGASTAAAVSAAVVDHMQVDVADASVHGGVAPGGVAPAQAAAAAAAAGCQAAVVGGCSVDDMDVDDVAAAGTDAHAPIAPHSAAAGHSNVHAVPAAGVAPAQAQAAAVPAPHQAAAGHVHGVHGVSAAGALAAAFGCSVFDGNGVAMRCVVLQRVGPGGVRTLFLDPGRWPTFFSGVTGMDGPSGRR